MRIISRQIQNQQGMTLLELLLVVTILSAVAWMSLGSVSNNTQQIRFEDTRNRLESIIQAIIGDTSRTLNGHTETRGFVADIGHLPVNLDALLTIDAEFCSDQQYSASLPCTTNGETWHSSTCTNVSYTNRSDCESNGFVWNTSYPAYSYDSATQLWHGWNGPYLPGAASASGKPRFLDGWGNDDGTDSYGWNYSLVIAADNTNLDMQSYAQDNAPGGANIYENDYPNIASMPVITNSQYGVKITDSGTTAVDDAVGGVTVDFAMPPSCWYCTDNSSADRVTCEAAVPVMEWKSDSAVPDAGACTVAHAGNAWQPTEVICLEIRTRKAGRLISLVSFGTSTLVMPNQNSGGQSFTWNDTGKSGTFVFEDPDIGPPVSHDNDTYLPQGRLAYRMVEFDNTAVPPACNTNKEYPKGAPWKQFDVVPGMQIPTLDWEVK